MFETLNSFWGGAVSVAGGLIVFISLYKALSNRPKVIAYDFRSERISSPKLPRDFGVLFRYDGKEYETIHKTEIIIKNETGSPLTPEAFLSPPVVKVGSAEICAVRKILEIDDSRGVPVLKNPGEVSFSDLMIPIDSSATFEIISVAPIDQSFQGIHRDSKTIKRNYGWPPRSKHFLYGGPILASLFSLVAVLIVSLTFGVEYVVAYANTLNSTWESLGASKSTARALTTFHTAIATFALSALYWLQLRATHAEKRFTELKQLA